MLLTIVAETFLLVFTVRATCLPSRKLSKFNEPDIQDPHIWPDKAG